jgi:(p)ppGpp synthase/HD superfamily hydrolase
MKTGVWLHDTIEDCRVNYNELAEKFNPQVAEVVYKVTNELGKNRAERATKTYPKIASCRLARLVKLADRIANTRYSIKTQSSMFEKYKEEYSKFKKIVKPRFINQFPDSPESLGWRTLDQLYYGSQPCKEEEVSVG